MHQKSWLVRRWKLVLNLVTLLALLIVIFAIRDQLGATFDNLKRVHGWALLLMLPVEVLNYHAQARLYQRLFRLVGTKLPYKFLYRASLELNFVNHVFPSGGLTGMSYFSLRLRSGKRLTAGKATLVHVMKIMLVFISFELVLLFALFSLAVMGRVNSLIIFVAGALSVLLIVGTAVFVYIVGSQKRINSFFTMMTRAVNRVIHVVRPSYPETISIERARGLFDDFHHNYREIKRSYRELIGPLGYALLANITEVLAIYVVYIAFGHWVNIGAVILAYAIANFAGLISVLPGGIGVYEALMTAVLASMGIPASLSLPVTVTYRVLNTLIQIPPGYYLYQRALHRGESVPVLIEESEPEDDGRND